MQKLNTGVSYYSNERTSVLEEGVFLDQQNNLPGENSTKRQRKQTVRKDGRKYGAHEADL